MNATEMISRIFFIFFLFLSALSWAQDPSILYLTWKDDPTTTMTVMWHTTTGDTSSTIHYKSLKETSWEQKNGETVQIKRSNVQVHQVELTGLEEGTDYLFRLGDGEIHKFRTLAKTLPLKIVIGGDGYLSKELYEKMNREVASKDPDFVILAGDIAYTEGLSRALKTYAWRVQRWEEFFELWTKDMITKDGRIIPIVPVLGNHDVREGFDSPFKDQVFFYEFFTFPEKGIPYRVMKIGSDICFYLLDSGHSFPVGGAQAEWLRKALHRNMQATWQIPVYHIGAYPSVTSYTHRAARDIRKFWVPLFEKYGVRASMEHDSHAFKRTYPIRRGKVAADGIHYLGDGAWGVPPEKPKDHWYLAKALQSNCYWLLTMDPSKTLFQAFNNEGVILDELTLEAKGNE